MRNFLHKLMVDLTRHSREVITPIWSKSWVCNAFRVYEYFFGRRAGQRFEGTCLLDGSYVHGTWENFLAHQEGRLRAFKNPFAFKLVSIPILIMPDGRTLQQNSIFNFAIAFDNAVNHGNFGVVSTASMSYTVTGSNTLLLSWQGGTVGGGAPTVTSETYNGVNLTSVNSVLVPSDRWWSMWILVGAATGANTLTATQSAASDFFLGAASYSGCLQSSQPDNSNNATQIGGTGISGSLTVNTANCWLVYMSSTRGYASTANSPGVARVNNGDSQMYDSNGIVSTGSNTCSITANLSGGSAGMVMVSIKPVAAASINSGFFFAAAI